MARARAFDSAVEGCEYEPLLCQLIRYNYAGFAHTDGKMIIAGCFREVCVIIIHLCHYAYIMYCE